MSIANEKQQLAINTVREGRNLFLTGSGGVGKSWVIKQLVDNYTVLCAPTGIASLNIGGSTCHSIFGLPTSFPVKSDYAKISPTLKQLFGKNSKVKRIIIDEIGMVRADTLDMIDHKLRLVRGSTLPFGGIQMVVVGDFFQLEPIVKREEKPLISAVYQSPFAFSAKCWDFDVVELTQVVRQSDEKQIALLQSIRRKSFDYKEALSTIQQQAKPYVNCVNTLHLCCYNNDADEINKYWYSKIKAKEIIYEGIGDGKDVPVDKMLSLKIGTKVLICANDPDRTYVNGDRGVITELYEESVLVTKDNGEEVIVTPFTWEKYKLKSTPKGIVKSLASKFTQLPIRLGWAVSIHKSQGMSLQQAAIHTGRGCFGNGQLYVALSRITDLSNLSFVSPVKDKEVLAATEVIEFYNRINND